MRHWIRRFTLQYSKNGQALNASNPEVDKDFLHEKLQVRVSLRLCWPPVVHQALRVTALATVGKFSHLAEACGAQWCDAALAARDAKARI